MYITPLHQHLPKGMRFGYYDIENVYEKYQIYIQIWHQLRQMYDSKTYWEAVQIVSNSDNLTSCLVTHSLA